MSASGQETVLYAFTGGTDGGGPYASLILRSAGNLYGTTYNGGASNAGVVYMLTPSSQESVLYSFTGGSDGGNPYAGVAMDSSGNLYGTTVAGGVYSQGVVYKLSPSGQETVLYTTGGQPGEIVDSAGNLYGAQGRVVYKISPTGQYTKLAEWNIELYGGYATGTLARDTAGNLYGTNGGPDSPPELTPYGAVFKVDTAGQFTVLYRFPGVSATGSSGGSPTGVILDSAGNIYGAGPGGVSGMLYEISTAGTATMLYNFTGAHGGTEPNNIVVTSSGEIYGTTFYGGAANMGTVYRTDATGRETVLHSFTGGTDGAIPPPGPVAVDSAGNVYGTTAHGGAFDQGVVYKIDASGTQTILHSFTDGADGGYPYGGVILGEDGNLYGTTEGGGSGSLTGIQEGVVFKMSVSGDETVLYSFTGLADGGVPVTGLVRDTSGNLYGATYTGGLGDGVVFKVTPGGEETALYSFNGEADGANPSGLLARDAEGNIYGTNINFGAGGGEWRTNWTRWVL